LTARDRVKKKRLDQSEHGSPSALISSSGATGHGRPSPDDTDTVTIGSAVGTGLAITNISYVSDLADRLQGHRAGVGHAVHQRRQTLRRQSHTATINVDQAA